MTKQEEIRGRQICEAAKKNGAETEFCELVKSPLSRGVNSASGIGFIEGAVWADKNPVHYNGQAMLHVLHKGVEQGKAAMLDKAIKWLHKHLLEYWQQSITDDSNFINEFKKAMEE